MVIRRFQPGDEKVVSDFVCRNFLEVNIKDYKKEWMLEWVKSYTAENIMAEAEETHMYVAVIDDKLVGCGAVGKENESEEGCELRTLFILPELQGQGIGRALIEVLEKDDWALAAKRVYLHSSITARVFYEKQGYKHVTGEPVLIDEDYYAMEKRK